MNKFRQTIIEFISYFSSYNKINLTIFILVFIGLLNLVFESRVLEFYLEALILCSPALLVHLCESTEDSKFFLLSLKEFSIGKKITSCVKKYMLLYLKVYLILTLILVVISAVVFISNISTFAMLTGAIDKSIGANLVLLLITGVLLSSSALLLSSFVPVVAITHKKNTVFKSIKLTVRFANKHIFKHIFSVMIFGFFIIPMMMFADYIVKLNSGQMLAYTIRSMYFILLVNYSIFDIKNRIDITPTHVSMFKKISMYFKNKK